MPFRFQKPTSPQYDRIIKTKKTSWFLMPTTAFVEFSGFRADNERMGRKRLIAFLVGFCVLLAPMLSSGVVVVPASVEYAQDRQPSNHSIEMADCESSHLGDHTTSGKASHGCCFNFVGILSATDLVQPELNTGERIPFSPSLSLSSRTEGLYRPPRQNS